MEVFLELFFEPRVSPTKTQDLIAMNDDSGEGLAKPMVKIEPSNPQPSDHISRMLRSMYGSIESEGIPDRFLDLLEKLDAAEKAQVGKIES
jgi:Anti-sigma factor NepR